MNTIRVALIGCGGITLQNHLPGLALCPDVEVAALCDSAPEVLEKARQKTGLGTVSTRYEEIVARDDVHAVIVATPNASHAPIALAAVRAGKHVLCEKPLAMNCQEAQTLAEAAERAGVRHMTAFTYRFVPAMQYLFSLVKSGTLGTPYHFRACRLQDWGQRFLGWRQVAGLAGSGELGDMLSHRIDFGRLLMGKMDRVVADTRRFVASREGQPSEMEDWVGMIVAFASGATGLLESSKLASGRSESWQSQDYVELNGSEASLVFSTERWNELQIGRKGGRGLDPLPVPEKFWKWPGCPRDIRVGNPLVTFRYDQAFEFIDAIRNQRPCVPSFHDGARVQAVMDAALKSAQTKQWVDVVEPNR